MRLHGHAPTHLSWHKITPRLAGRFSVVASGLHGYDNSANALAVQRAGEDRARDSVAASDAFFPFADGLELLARAGVKAIVSPGGSVRDQEVIDAAQAAGVTLYHTGARHFFH